MFVIFHQALSLASFAFDYGPLKITLSEPSDDFRFP